MLSVVQLLNSKYPDMPLNFVVPNLSNSICIVIVALFVMTGYHYYFVSVLFWKVIHPPLVHLIILQEFHTFLYQEHFFPLKSTHAQYIETSSTYEDDMQVATYIV